MPVTAILWYHVWDFTFGILHLGYHISDITLGISHLGYHISELIPEFLLAPQLPSDRYVTLLCLVVRNTLVL